MGIVGATNTFLRWVENLNPAREEGMSVDVVLHGSGEAQVRDAEGVHQVGLVDAGAQLGGAAQPTGDAMIPVQLAIMLHRSPQAWVYGLGQNWSLQIQFLLLAQSLSVAFLSKRLHLAALVQKLPIFELWWADSWLLFRLV